MELICSAESNPPAQFNWFFNGKKLNNSPTFSDTASLNHIGTYTCHASNSYTGLNRTKEKNLMIYGPLPKPTISSSHMIPVENRDTVSLTCLVRDEIQVVTYRWFINESAASGNRIQLSPDNRILTIRTVTRKDEGSYVCEIENPYTSNRNVPFTLNVAYGPDTPMIVTAIDHYNVGEYIELSCSAVSNPPAQFTWYLNGKKFSNSSTYSANASMDHAGTYTCEASNSITGLNNTKEKSLTIYGTLSRPTINSSNVMPVENKDNVSLICQAEGIIVKYRWFINKRAPASDRIELSPDNRTLTINNITRKDRRPHMCEIENPTGRNRSYPFTPNVAYGPNTPQILPTVNRYHVGANIILSCSAESNPRAQFTWFHNQKKVSKSATFSATASLDHAGTYTCFASNSYTGLNSTRRKFLKIFRDENLPVYAQHTIYENLMQPDQTMYSSSFIIENGTAVLTCDVGDEYFLDVRWFFQNKKLILNERKILSDRGHTLTIKPVKREDLGAYQCEIWNPFLANTSGLFNLTVVYGPEQIMISPKPVHGQIEAIFKENLTLECRANSQPPAQYIWQVNDSSISGNSSINNYTISQASWEHAGMYTCIAVNKMSNATISTKVTVRVIYKKALSGWAIAGIVIGVLVGVLLFSFLLFFWLLFTESSREEGDETYYSYL
ncbi:carcinoembryonic antigen-related cell adhesion molecule 5-like [Gracilinanus agilis]|uniref:carcinoembryonic antigen-related cell adhesion molecule 5-like n=1 Tax=Gracilinanus agilis TaxID=191870 RepID=UPI001CFF4B44|nr:carcinoembryonic antigen-related cell adhesion molecule 5-like [Gracilinanus agilis]